MKTYQKVLSLFSVFPLLTACSQQTYAGVYTFQMGKSKDTHIGVYLTLSDEVFNPSTPEKGNRFELLVDLSMGTEESEMLEILEEFNPLMGNYYVKEDEQVYEGTRLHLGLSVLGDMEIPEELTDLIFVANISSNAVNFYLPVSLKDLTLQLYWYGYDISMESIIEFIISGEEPVTPPEGAHPVGTHPTADDIAQINTHYKTDHAFEFRDYHVLELGLTKK